MSLVLDEGILRVLVNLGKPDENAEKLACTECIVGVDDYVSIGDMHLMYDAEYDGISIYNDVLDGDRKMCSTLMLSKDKSQLNNYLSNVVTQVCNSDDRVVLYDKGSVI